MSECGTIELLTKLYSIKAGVETRDWYDYLTLIIQAVASSATLWAVLVALTPQRKAETIELHNITYGFDKKLVFHWKSWKKKEPRVATYCFTTKYDEVVFIDSSDDAAQIPYGISRHRTPYSLLKWYKIEQIKKIKLLTISYDNGIISSFRVTNHHKKQIEKFINQK